MRKRRITVGVFLGLIAQDGRILFQVRTEQRSILGRHVSFTGGYELPGGGAKGNDLRKILRPEYLIQEAVRKTRQDLGPTVHPDHDCFREVPLYRTVYREEEKEDWAFMIPIQYKVPQSESLRRKVVYLNPDELHVFADRNAIVSGKRRMWRMGEAALFLSSSNPSWRDRAAELLTQAKPDWQQTEYFENAQEALAQFRTELGIEGI